MSSMREETTIGGGAVEFPATRWTLIQSSRQNDVARREALDVLLSTYWKPLYFYVRRKGTNIEAAKDAVQGFFAHLLEQDFLARPDPSKGKFRSYLRTAIDNYLANLHENQTAQKRGGAVRTVPLDFDVAERELPAAPETPDAAYNREWALGVMERATHRLQREFADGVRQGPLNVFTDYFKTGQAPAYEQSAKAHDMSVPQFKSFLHRTRERYRELVRSEVVHTVADAGSADEEIAELLRALRS